MTRLLSKLAGALCACTLLNAPLFATETNTYAGVWTSQSPALTLKITDDRAEISLDGKTLIEEKLQYAQNVLPTAPFLSINAQETEQHLSHRFYLMRSENSANQPQLNGYYERITLNPNGEKIAKESFPVALQLASQQTAAR